VKKRPNSLKPPLEVSFYCDVPTTEKDDFLSFVKALMMLGAKPTGYANGKRIKFAPDALDNLFATPDDRPFSIGMTNVLGLMPKGEPETVQLNYITQKALDLGDHCTFTILGDIDLLSKKTIPPLIKRFVEIVEVIRPLYACFCFIDYLECPVDLEHGSNEFHDFYVSRRALGDHHYRKLLEGYKGAYRQEFEHGLYLSTTTMNPLYMSRHNPFSLENIEVERHGVAVAQVIHQRWMNRKLYGTDENS
jgi:hypothetical protein